MCFKVCFQRQMVTYLAKKYVLKLKMYLVSKTGEGEHYSWINSLFYFIFGGVGEVKVCFECQVVNYLTKKICY